MRPTDSPSSSASTPFAACAPADASAATTSALSLEWLAGWCLAVIAIWLPTLIAIHDSPSTTFYNQVCATFGWGAWLAWQAHVLPNHVGASGKATSSLWAISAVFLMQAAFAVYSGCRLGLPAGLSMMGSGLATAGLLALWGGWRSGLAQQGQRVQTIFFGILLAAGVVGAVLAAIQVFMPGLADGGWIAQPTRPGLAVGNLRQPNHFSTLMVFACVAWAWLGAKRRLPEWLMHGLMAIFIQVIVQTASRTGMAGVVLLVIWAMADKHLPASVRRVLALTPIWYGLCWGGMWLLAHHNASVAFASEARLHDHSDISSSRFKIWANVLTMIGQQPWLGVGYGRFNFAWSMTAFDVRPIAFFDHTHNLPLQWAVELGVPMALLLTWLVVRAWAGLVFPMPWQPSRERLRADPTLGACAAMVTLAAIHSQVEYPMWYSYFLLPSAFAFGLGLACRAQVAKESPPTASAVGSTVPAEHGWRLAPGLIMAGLSLWCVLDYQFAANVYAPRPGAGALIDRIRLDQGMPWWGYQADYAWVNLPEDDEPSRPPHEFHRTVFNLMDTRLMTAYARSLYEHGQTDKARYVSQRLREFHNPDAVDWFEACPTGASAAPALDAASLRLKLDDSPNYACEQPRGHYTWRDLVP